MTEHDQTGAFDPPLSAWPEPADDPEVEPEEDWATDPPAESEGGEA